MPREGSARELYEATLSGAHRQPLIPPLRSDQSPYTPIPKSLPDYRTLESDEQRTARLRALWHRLPKHFPASGDTPQTPSQDRRDATPISRYDYEAITREHAEELSGHYERELARHFDCNQNGRHAGAVDWDAFLKYAEQKERELWHIFHDKLDLDGNGILDAVELQHALTRAGIELNANMLTDFMAFLTTAPHPRSISFPEFRDFLLLLPRDASVSEIYRYYEVRKWLGDDGRGAARVNMEGDVSLSAEDRPLPKQKPAAAWEGLVIPTVDPISSESPIPVDMTVQDGQQPSPGKWVDDEEEEEHDANWLGGDTALRFLLAGGIAGAVSRSCTAPFDRLKVYLITRRPDMVADGVKSAPHGAKVILNAVKGIYAESGVLGFWIGNGLNVIKIFPESAIKFLTYESSKRFLAKYWDDVDDQRNISGGSRFLAGGLGGITSQLSIYPIEMVKTQLQSSLGGQHHAKMLAATIKRLYATGGIRAYYRGLPAGLIGVFPYSAIDMSTFEALKLAYIKATGKEEPGVLALLSFGSVSGSVGATSVYPINLVRTRLQASGSSGHPQQYTGVWDVARKTYQNEGWKGFYRGLIPTLAKVIPAVSISYVVYEHSKRRLGV